MSDENHTAVDGVAFNDDTLLSDLTVGQFKQLLTDLLAQHTLAAPTTDATEEEAAVEKAEVKRMSLDDFMSDLTG